MSTTEIKKMFDEAYCYAKRIEALDNPYAGYGDFYHLRVTGATALRAVAGTESNDVSAGDTVFVAALSPVRLSTKVGKVVFSGSGLNDATSGGTFSGSTSLDYKVQIDGLGTPDTFKWSDDGGATWNATGVAITGSAQTLNNGVTITFAATTGHTNGDSWSFVAGGAEVNLNDTDFVSFHGGDPIGTCKTKVISSGKTLSASSLATGGGKPGDEFLVLKNPDVDSADGLLLYVQSKSDTPNERSEKLYYDHNIFRGHKVIARTEPNTLSIGQHFQAHDKGLLGFRGHRFNLLVERDDNREGTITEKEYYIGCHFPNAGPNESTGDSESDVSFDIQYLWKCVVAG